MTASSPRFSWSNLLGFGSVPGNPAEVRAFLQRRVRQYIAVLTLFWGLTVVAEVGLRLASPEMSVSHPLRTYGSAVLVLAGVWLWLRRGQRSERALSVMDAGATWGMMALHAHDVSGASSLQFRPDLQMAFTMSIMLMMRAALVPGTGRRAAIIGGVSSMMMIGSCIRVYFSYPNPYPFSPVAIVFTWTASALLITVITALVSRTIHGLQRKVREAMRLGQYALEEKIGEGGMGVVYRARHAMMRRPTAVKLLPPERSSEKAIARFEREVQLTCQLSHPNTIAIYDFGRTPEGVFYYAMEYLDGVDLATLVREDGPLPPGRVRHVLVQAAGALAEAHAAGLVHRDIKPANLMLCERGGQPDVLKVLDFGLVKDVDGSDESVTGAVGPALVGTPLYMAPEALRAPGRVDARSDLYSLGVTAWYLLTGKPLFTGSKMEICAHHLHTPAPPPSERRWEPVPAALERVVMACLEKSPEQRPDSAQALLEMLRGCQVAPWDEAEARQWWTEWRRRRGARAAAPLRPGRRDVSMVNDAGATRPEEDAGEAGEAEPTETLLTA